MDWTTPTLGAVCGLALGSFIATAAMRYARGDGFLSGRSRCDGCGQSLSYVQTAPLISYARLGGTCAGCRASIDPVHPLGEAAGAVVLISAVGLGNAWSGALLGLLGLCLIALSVVDAKTRRIPDVLSLAVAVCAAALSWMRGPEDLLESIAWALGAMALLETLRRWVGRGGREPGLGFGDVKLIGALALWLGEATPLLVSTAAILGLAWAKMARPADSRLPFGPFLAVGAWLSGWVAEGWLWP